MNIGRRAFLISGGAAAFAQDVTFRTEVKLVRMLATVKDANGALIGGLVDFLIQLATGRCLGVWCLF